MMKFHATMKESGDDGVLCITSPDGKKTWEIKDKSSMDVFVDDITNVYDLTQVSFLCSSSIDFPEEYTQDEELLAVIENIFHQQDPDPDELPDTCCPNCMHDCYGEKPNRYCLECDWKEVK